MSNLMSDDDSDEIITVFPGMKAPDFQLVTEKRNAWRLSDNLGKVIALLFYPKNETLVCTKQMCSLRDNWSNYQATEAIIVGISPGTAEANEKFSQRYYLPILLLADVDRKVTEIYGSHWFFPTIFMRTVVIIDAKGIVRSRENMLRAFRPPDNKVITAIYAARADYLSEAYSNLKRSQL